MARSSDSFVGAVFGKHMESNYRGTERSLVDRTFYGPIELVHPVKMRLLNFFIAWAALALPAILKFAIVIPSDSSFLDYSCLAKIVLSSHSW